MPRPTLDMVKEKVKIWNLKAASSVGRNGLRETKTIKAWKMKKNSPEGSFRRDRAKFSQPWFKKDNGDTEEYARDEKPPDWRRDRRDRDWDRQPKAEAEPEWMDAAEPEEPFQARTQEDFQRWKEKMKAGTATPQDKVGPTITEAAQPAPKLASPEPDNSMDKFFAKFESKVGRTEAWHCQGAWKDTVRIILQPGHRAAQTSRDTTANANSRKTYFGALC